MEELIFIVVILLLVFGFGTVQFTPSFDVPGEAEQIGNIGGNETFNFVEEGDINLDFQGHITGNSRVNIQSERGDIYLRFREQITGNSRVEIKARRGDVFIGFDRFIEGNPTVKIESRGNVVFANDRSTIKEYMGKNLLEINADGRIYYGNDSFFRRFRSVF